MKNKKGGVDKSILVQIILIGIVFSLFMVSTFSKIEGRGLRQDVIESQIAMAIGAGVPGMRFEINKINVNGIISNVKVENGKIFILLDGLNSFDGKSYYSRYDVLVVDEKGKFVVVIE